MSDDICNRIEALGFICERWNINGDFRWVTGPNNHTTVCYFKHPTDRFRFGFVTECGLVSMRRDGQCFTIAEFEERMKDDKPF